MDTLKIKSLEEEVSKSQLTPNYYDRRKIYDKDLQTFVTRTFIPSTRWTRFLYKARFFLFA